MQQWEYMTALVWDGCVLSTNSETYARAVQTDLASELTGERIEVTPWLNDIGAKGWELCASHQTRICTSTATPYGPSQTADVQLVFKRPKRD